MSQPSEQPSGRPSLESLVRSAADPLAASTAVAAVDALNQSDRALSRLLENESIASSPFRNSTLRPAKRKAAALRQLLRDDLSIHPFNVVSEHDLPNLESISVPFGALIPRDQLNILMAQCASMN
ncbi:hypothetical protein [Mycobacterium avium]